MKRVRFGYKGGFPLEQETLIHIQSAYADDMSQALFALWGLEKNGTYRVKEATQNEDGWIIKSIPRIQINPGTGDEYPVQQLELMRLKFNNGITNFIEVIDLRSGNGDLVYGDGTTNKIYEDWVAQYAESGDAIEDIYDIAEVLLSIEGNTSQINTIKEDYLPRDGSKPITGDLDLDYYNLTNGGTITSKNIIVEGSEPTKKLFEVNGNNDTIKLSNLSESTSQTPLVIDGDGNVGKGSIVSGNSYRKVVYTEDVFEGDWLNDGFEITRLVKSNPDFNVNNVVAHTLTFERGTFSNRPRVFLNDIAVANLYVAFFPENDIKLVLANGDDTTGNIRLTLLIDDNVLQVNAGVDQTINIADTSQVTLNGTASDQDGIDSIAWTQESGGTANIQSPNDLQTIVSGLETGTYEFLLTVTDNKGGISTDRVFITVIPEVTIGIIPSDKNAYFFRTGDQIFKDPDSTIEQYVSEPFKINLPSDQFTTQTEPIVQGVDFNVTVETEPSGDGQNYNLILSAEPWLKDTNAIRRETNLVITDRLSENSIVLKCIQIPLSPVDDDGDTTTSTTLTIRPGAENNLSNTSHNIDVTVNSNKGWQITGSTVDSGSDTSAATYSSSDASGGPGSKTITISIGGNILDDDRSGTVSFETTDNQKSTTFSWAQDKCFDLESNILMANGKSKKLKSILVGDLISAYSFANVLQVSDDASVNVQSMFKNSNRISVEVTDFGTSTVDSYRRITLVNGTILNVTESHPLLASKDQENVQWLLPDDLRSGVYLINKDGEFVEIESKRTVNETLEIGVLQLKGADNYFVSGVMVHNTQIIRSEKTLATREAGNREAISLTNKDAVFKIEDSSEIPR